MPGSIFLALTVYGILQEKSLRKLREPVIMKNKSKNGFTLVEIIILVVIVGLLAAMAIPGLTKTNDEEEPSQSTQLTNEQ